MLAKLRQVTRREAAAPQRTGSGRRYLVTTPDGWDLALHRPHPPAPPSGGAGAPAPARPVLLLSGYGTSAESWSPRDPGSLPAHLAAAGLDPWLLDFRGAGASRHTHAERPVVCIDRKIRFDLPQAIDAVLRETGASAVDLVGHSMGGVIIYGYLAVFGEAPVRRVVTLSSPGYFRRSGPSGEPAFRLRARVLRHSLRLVERVPTRNLMQLVTRVPLRGAYGMHFHPDNVDDARARAYMRDASTDIYRAELQQILRWFETGEITDRTGTMSYSDHFDRIRAPILFLAAGGDRIVDRQAVRWVHDRVASTEKEYREVGVVAGAVVDFGHTDLVAGRHAPRDVFPHVVGWLTRGGDR